MISEMWVESVALLDDGDKARNQLSGTSILLPHLHRYFGSKGVLEYQLVPDWSFLPWYLTWKTARYSIRMYFDS